MPLGPPEDPNRFGTFEECVDALSEDMPEDDAREVCGAWENRAMSKDRDTFTKNVEFVGKDDAQQIASGIVMVPQKVDLQGDYATEGTIQRFAEQYGNFEDVGEAGEGVMHSVWPPEHTSLEQNTVLNEPTDIGGTDAPEGAWVQSWQFNDDELWSLVDDGVLEGYSIGAVDVEWSPPVAQDDLPDVVSVPQDYPEDNPAWELRDGIIQEVSAVDIPAVPDAMILETKDVGEKCLADHLGDRDGFIEEAMERGHSEDDAARLWDYLDRAIDIEGAGEPGTGTGTGNQSMLARAGKAFLSALSGDESDDDSMTTSEASEPGSSPNADPEKEGRTLSRQNRNSLKASVDASLDVLEDGGVDHGMSRFTDRDDDAFDLSEHSAREWPDDEDDEMDVSPFENAAAGDSDPPADTGGTKTANSNMTDEDTDTATDTDPFDDAPEWAKELRDGQQQNSKRIDEVAGDDGGDDSDAWEDAPEWAKSLKENQEQNAERIDTISRQTGTDSQQLGKSADGAETNGGISERQAFFIPGSKRGEVR